MKSSSTGTPNRARAANLMHVPPPVPGSERSAERAAQLRMLHTEMAACQSCVVAGYLQTAGSVAGYRGRVSDRMVIVGQAPGRLSAERGKPFSGPSGKALDLWLQQAGYPPGALYTHVYLSALTKCDPGKAARGKGDRKPSPPELTLCRPYLERELDLVRPRAILLVGTMAIEAFLGPIRLEDAVGQAFERNGVHLLPLPHPSGVSRWLNNQEHQRHVLKALELLADRKREWEKETFSSAS